MFYSIANKSVAKGMELLIYWLRRSDFDKKSYGKLEYRKYLEPLSILSITANDGILLPYPGHAKVYRNATRNILIP